MSEIASLLRLLVQSDKEGKVTVVNITLDPTLFTSQLTEGYTRKSFTAYNNSDQGSGECFYGYSESMSPSGESHPIPLGSSVKIDVNTDIPTYFCCVSGELGQLRIEELA